MIAKAVNIEANDIISCGDIDSLYHRLNKIYLSFVDKNIHRAFYSVKFDDTLLTSGKISNYMWLLDELKFKKKNNIPFCVCKPSQLKSLMSDIKSLVRNCIPDTVYERTDINLNKSNALSWMAKNPNCLGGPQWYRVSNFVCDKLKIVSQHRITPIETDISVEQVISKYDHCKLTYDIKIGQLPCEIVYLASIASYNCNIDYDIKISEKDCKTSYEALIKEKDCTYTFDISLDGKKCDFTHDIYVKMIECKFTPEMIAKLVDCDLKYDIDVKNKCINVITDDGLYNMCDLTSEQLTTDVVNNICDVLGLEERVTPVEVVN